MTTINSLFTPLDSTSRAGTEGGTNLADDFNNFLNLLTVQLQHQDPLEPLDTNQFTEQLVQMTEVEQTVSMNERLGALIDAQETQRIQSAVDFVGKHADALGDIVPLGPEGADLFYAINSPALSVTAEIIDTSISDPSRQVVRRLDAPSTDAGVHRMAWDGLDNDGVAVDPNRDYRLRVTALDLNGNPKSVRIGFSGLAEELRHEDGALMLSVAGRQVPLDQIVAARAPAPKQTAAE